jgi:hypothetical protein
MSTALSVLAEHGITMTDEELGDLIRQAIADTPPLRSVGLPPEEAAIYDAAGMTEAAGAYRRHLTDIVTQYLSLLTHAVPVTDAAVRLGVTRGRIQQMITAHDVWALRDQKGRWVLPEVQFDDTALLPGWSSVARAIPVEAHPLEVLAILTTPQPELEVDGAAVAIPDWLRSGGGDTEAARLVASLAEAGL